MRLGNITDWLEQLEPSSEHAIDATVSCGPKHQQHHPLSPPESQKRQRSMSAQREPKRQKVHDDPNKTPRGNSSWQGVGAFQTDSPTTSLPPPSEPQSQSQSQASGRSSPSKALGGLEINPDGIKGRRLSPRDPRMPQKLTELLMELQMTTTSGVGLISSNSKAEIRAEAKKDPEFCLFLDHMFADPKNRDRIGPTPPVHQVIHLVAEAAECHLSRQNEAGWNMMVHHPLLFTAIYSSRRQNQLVGFAPCTTAKIIKEYVSTASQPKMVDFCIYMDPTVNEAASDAVQILRRMLPAGVINHTDFQPLRDRPIAISIETKSRGRTQPETAELQLGTWHAAQWRFLEDLVSRTGGSLDGLPFLPAVIVQGHSWSFAATTREGHRTDLWTEYCFGSTSDVAGVYKAIWGLQRLALWAREVYWPWFEKNGLGVEDDEHIPNSAA
ncbi:hypothetical protein NW754_013646 [Fusarium falciforme]|nr:hypothetical protein NW754_013646 [Fusarium falciforme]